jgi:protein DGCR14
MDSLQVANSQGRNAALVRSLNRQTVLEEDEYTEALSRIIARDFFPSLVHLEANNDYLDALTTEDPARVDASIRRLSQLQDTSTPRFSSNDFPTPYGGCDLETPSRRRPWKRRRLGDDSSLDEFQAKYTSEDNSSFTEILDDENKQRRQRWDWAWDAQRRVEETKAKQLETREHLLIEPSAAPGVRERLAIEMPRIGGLITEDGRTGTADSDAAEATPDSDQDVPTSVVLLGTGKYGDSESLVKDPLTKVKDSRPAGVDGWTFKVSQNMLLIYEHF